MVDEENYCDLLRSSGYWRCPVDRRLGPPCPQTGGNEFQVGVGRNGGPSSSYVRDLRGGKDHAGGILESRGLYREAIIQLESVSQLHVRSISFLARRSPLTSGKHPPGITNDVCSDLGPFHRSFHVGRDYAMWATITAKQKMRPTSERKHGPHRPEYAARHAGIAEDTPGWHSREEIENRQ